MPPFLIGLTGGIGSGKTVVSNYFAKLGVPIVDTDIIAREIVTKNSEILKKLTTTFGSQIINEEGNLDRDTLRKIAFNNRANKAMLDNIMHPIIHEHTLKQIKKTSYSYCIVVVPLLVETDFKDVVDRVLVVIAKQSDRINWIKKRSSLSNKEINNIIQSQTQDDIRLKYADDVIHNNSSIKALIEKIEALHKKYIHLASNY